MHQRIRWGLVLFSASASLALAQTVVLPDGSGGTETFERPETSQVEESGAVKMSWETLQLGEVKLDLPTTYEVSLDRGEILGHPYFAKFVGRSYPDIFVMDTVFEGDIEELGNSFYKNYLRSRFQLSSLQYLSGTPRKLLLGVQGVEMRYQIYFVSLNQRNAFLIFVVPVPPQTDYAALGEQIIKTVRLH
jgi:hypothetical protein